MFILSSRLRRSAKLITTQTRRTKPLSASKHSINDSLLAQQISSSKPKHVARTNVLKILEDEAGRDTLFMETKNDKKLTIADVDRYLRMIQRGRNVFFGPAKSRIYNDTVACQQHSSLLHVFALYLESQNIKRWNGKQFAKWLSKDNLEALMTSKCHNKLDIICFGITHADQSGHHVNSLSSVTESELTKILRNMKHKQFTSLAISIHAFKYRLNMVRSLIQSWYNAGRDVFLTSIVCEQVVFGHDYCQSYYQTVMPKLKVVLTEALSKYGLTAVGLVRIGSQDEKNRKMLQYKLTVFSTAPVPTDHLYDGLSNAGCEVPAQNTANSRRINNTTSRFWKLICMACDDWFDSYTSNGARRKMIKTPYTDAATHILELSRARTSNDDLIIWTLDIKKIGCKLIHRPTSFKDNVVAE